MSARSAVTAAATLEVIAATGVVAVVRLRDASGVRQVADALLAGGVRAIEVTMTVPRAVEIIADLAATAPRELVIGAGTVTDAETAQAVIAAGASFVVSPMLDLPMVAACRVAGVPVMPGCFTPTEIVTAVRAGADAVKVFPATTLGPTYFKDVRGPFPDLRLMPTGGVTAENAASWIRAGAWALGAGGALVDPALVQSGQFAAITARAQAFITAVASARAEGGR